MEEKDPAVQGEFIYPGCLARVLVATAAET